MSGLLRAIQTAAADRLSSDDWFSTVTVLTENQGDIEYKINEALGQIGIVAILLTPVAEVSNPNVPGPWFDRVAIVVRVIENVVLNRATGGTGKWSSEAVELAAGLLHLYEPTEVSGVFTVDRNGISIQPSPKPGLITYDLLLSTDVQIQLTAPEQVATPALTFLGGEITVTCATAGAAVFYATDGTYPAPRGSTSQLYLAPFTPGPGKTVRARAWLAGYAASEVASLNT